MNSLVEPRTFLALSLRSSLDSEHSQTSHERQRTYSRWYVAAWLCAIQQIGTRHKKALGEAPAIQQTRHVDPSPCYRSLSPDLRGPRVWQTSRISFRPDLDVYDNLSVYPAAPVLISSSYSNILIWPYGLLLTLGNVHLGFWTN